MDFYTVLEHCGSNNRYQWLLLFLFFYLNLLSPIHYAAQPLIGFTPEHRCYHEKLKESSFGTIKELYAPFKNPECTLLSDIINSTAIESKSGSCHRWIYQYESGYDSVTSELNWVCEDEYNLTIGQSFFYIGNVIGTIFFGFLADKIGRLPALILCSLSGAFGDFFTSFVYTLPMFTFGRFLSGLSAETMYNLSFILVFEYLDPKNRNAQINIISSFSCCLGSVVSPWLAVWMGSWRKFLLVTSLPFVSVLALPLFICESAQWLLTKGNYKKAVHCLKRVAKINKRKVEQRVFDEFVQCYENKSCAAKKSEEHEDTFWDMFRTPRLRKFTFILFLTCMIVKMSGDILYRDMEDLGTSPFVLSSLTSLVYIPSGIIVVLMQNTIGRKGTTTVSLVLTSILAATTSALIALLDHQKYSLLIALMVGMERFSSNLAFSGFMQYAAEIIPTSIRGSGLSNVMVVGSATNFFGSYVILLGKHYKPAPSIFISFLMLIGSLLSLPLPETLNKKSPDTIAEGENFAVGDPLYSVSCLQKAPKKTVFPEGKNLI